MSKLTNRDTAPGTGAPVERRLARLLDSPALPRLVPALPAETLHHFIRHCGLDACTDLVALATPAQLTTVLDVDLWRPDTRAGDHVFDVDRFGTWIEVLANADIEAAAKTIASLDVPLVVAGLSRYIRVFDPGVFEPIEQSDDEMPVRHWAMRQGDARDGDMEPGAFWLESELGGYIVRARRTDAWDAIVSLLTELDNSHADRFHAVMEGCRRLSSSCPEIDGLDDRLDVPEQQLHEVTSARESRRSRQGYATAADARAFLQAARQRQTETSVDATRAIFSAYFRAAEGHHAELTDGETKATAPGGPNQPLLAELDILPARSRGLLAAPNAASHPARLTHLRRLLATAVEADVELLAKRTSEMAFIANTLIAGCTVMGRAFTQNEASDAAASICNLGLEIDAARPARIDLDLVTAFEIGWSTLYQDVCVFTAENLMVALAGLDATERSLRRELSVLRRKLAEQLEAGTPWRVHGALEVLTILDPLVFVAVRGLLDECPVLPAALTAAIAGGTTRVAPDAFELISTTSEIDAVRRFVQNLPAMLTT